MREKRGHWASARLWACPWEMVGPPHLDPTPAGTGLATRDVRALARPFLPDLQLLFPLRTDTDTTLWKGFEQNFQRPPEKRLLTIRAKQRQHGLRVQLLTLMSL